MKHDFKSMITNGQMAKEIGVDPKTLRQWAKGNLVPSFVNPANNYRYYPKIEVLRALKLLHLNFNKDIDRN